MTPESQVYRRALTVTCVTLAGLAVVAGAVGWLIADAAGLIAGIVGAAVAALGAVPTQVAMLIAHKKSSQALAGIVLFAWLGKMVIIVIALVALGSIEDFHRPMFGVTVAVGLVASLGIDLWSLQRSRVPYVEPGT